MNNFAGNITVEKHLKDKKDNNGTENQKPEYKFSDENTQILALERNVFHRNSLRVSIF